MPASEARILANRQNSLKSSGPKTVEGKQRSRRNGFKHGLSGSGVVLADRDASEVQERAGALMAELGPKSSLGAILIGQMATLSVRMERGATQEEEALASRARHAAEAFDQGRVDRAESRFDAIADDPQGALRELRRSPEGVDRLVEAWQALKANLNRIELPNYWEPSDHAMLLRLAGQRPEDSRGTRLEWLSRVLRASYTPPPVPESGCLGLDERSRRVWVKAQVIERIDAALAELTAHRATLDLEAIRLDRLGAADLAPFDTSREASLARRYEAEARRGFFRSLREFRKVEAEFEAVDRPEPAIIAEPELEPELDPVPAPEALASSCAGEVPTPREPGPVAEREPFWPPYRYDGVARGLDGRVVAIGRAVVVPG